jgi:hypothetical protein
MKIYCPLCAYAPRAHDQWECAPGCHTVWNTFDTAGRCPGCSKQWHLTCCPACARWSQHDDWYHAEDGDQADERQHEPWRPERERERTEEYEEELVGIP